MLGTKRTFADCILSKYGSELNTMPKFSLPTMQNLIPFSASGKCWNQHRMPRITLTVAMRK